MAAGWAVPKYARKRHYFDPGGLTFSTRPDAGQTCWTSLCGQWWERPAALYPEAPSGLFEDCKKCRRSYEKRVVNGR